jgi:hypothetical protein
LAGERILQLGREDGDAVQEQHQVEAVRAGRAVAQLADDREQVRRVQPARLVVQATGRAEIREVELAAGVLDAMPQHVERATALDLRREPLEELVADGRAVVLLEPLPLPGLASTKSTTSRGSKHRARS